MSTLERLRELRKQVLKPGTLGLSDEVIARFLKLDPSLDAAIQGACDRYPSLRKEFPELLALSDTRLLEEVQRGILNFYSTDTVSPYVPLAAKGPWIVTVHGAVIYDSGGYGMLGLGHDPDPVREALARPQVMANVMTPSISQHRYVKALRSVIGAKRGDRTCPYDRFIFLNSGSEASSVAARIADAHAKVMTDSGGKHAGEPIASLSLKGSFHGRTTAPARVSDSSRKYYAALASFRSQADLFTVEPNNVSDLEATFAKSKRDGVYIDLMWLEPVMGEGNPGLPMTPEFYSAARRLTKEHDTLLLIDSIQAGFRAQGVLSITDYPGFESLEPPDMETFSKIINAGQYPLSVLALRERAAQWYKTGTYGNTMTGNPRAMDVATAVLRMMTPELSRNISERGREILEKLSALQVELPSSITKVQGTGLLISVELASHLPVVGLSGVETAMRRLGVNVIHGGKNALRFTPHFGITSAEIELVTQVTREAIRLVGNEIQAT